MKTYDWEDPKVFIVTYCGSSKIPKAQENALSQKVRCHFIASHQPKQKEPSSKDANIFSFP